MTRPRGSVIISSRLATGSTASSESPWKIPDWASTSSTARPLATDPTERFGVRVRRESRRLCIRSPVRWADASLLRASGPAHDRPRRRRGKAASDDGRVRGHAGLATTTSPAEECPPDAGGGQGVDLAGRRGVQELGDLAGGGRAAQRLLDALHDQQERDQQRREEDDAEGDHAYLLDLAAGVLV